MASVAVTINIDSSIIPTVEECLCAAAGLPVSAANAKLALIEIIRTTVANVQTSQQPLPAPISKPSSTLFS